MKTRHTISAALNGLASNKVRSGLTVLGIIIGIASIILMVSIGKGAEKLILGELAGFGVESIVVRPGKEPKGPSDLADTLFADSLKRRDVDALSKKSNVPHAVDVTPMLVVPGSVSYAGETFRPDVFGTRAEFWAETFDLYPERGVFFDDQDVKQNASVAVIGSKVKEELFGESDALGESIRIRDRKFRVVGVLESRGQIAFANIDEMVLVPYTTAQQYLMGIDYFHEVILKASGAEYVSQTVADIERTLRSLHRIDDPENDDFFVVTQEGMVEQIRSIIGSLTVFLSSVVAIALVVGGIGVMNIMLVSVTERTREIGLRKALGATERDIRNQFLLEAVILTGIGGVVGILIGASLSYVIAFAISNLAGLEWEGVFPLGAALLGLGVSTVVGLIFGLYPARRAARKSPIEALRYE
jgi:putative ABC transport system permease protein